MGKDTTEVRTDLNGSRCPDLELRIRRLGSQVAQTEGAGVCRWAQVRGWPLNRDVLPLNIKGALRFLRKQCRVVRRGGCVSSGSRRLGERVSAGAGFGQEAESGPFG